MPAELTLYGASPDEVMNDVYYHRDFAEFHSSGNRIESIARADFGHLAMVRTIPGTGLQDLETPWGYGGPVGLDRSALEEGISEWRARQAAAGRVAEFMRFHPFLNVEAFADLFDRVVPERNTVLVDLREPDEEQRRTFSKGTRYSIRMAQERTTLSRIGAADARLFHTLYTAGLDRNEAEDRHYLSLDDCRSLLAAEWCDSWISSYEDEPVAVACFLRSGRFAHYHLSGGTERSRESFAHYGLLMHAMDHYRSVPGVSWLHLGGGRTASEKDALLAFKKKFSGNLIPSCIGGWIHDPDAYARLAPPGDSRILAYRLTQ